MSIVRAVLGEAPVISIAAREGYIAVTPTGTAGPAGPASEWRFHSGYLQARPVDLSSDWANVIAVSAITGPMPDHSWSGTQLRFETSPGVWGSYVDLKGDAVEIGVSGGFIRWRPTGGSWTNIVELADLIGPDGPAIEVQTTATHIQWRVVGDPTWIDLVALADLKGDQGDPGPIGINLPLGPWNSGTTYVARDVVNKDGSSWICLVGHTNQSPPTLPTTANTYWSLLAKIGDTPTSLDISGVAGLTSELLGSAHSAITVAATDIVWECIYDTTLDDDKGAWRHRCAHTSWWQETLNTATRGSKREPPAKAKIVARAGSITIYDLTDLDTSGAARLWKQFATGGTIGSNNHNKLATAADVVGSVFALNGRLYVSFATTTNFGFTEIDFIADRATSHRGSELRRYRGGLGGAEGLGSTVVGSQTILTGNAPHVHALVYPGAPVDTLGLPIPKVVVSTAAGASVIHEDGAVYDITVASGYVQGRLLDGGRLMLSRASADIVEFGPVPYADIANTSWRTNTAFGTGTAGASNLRVAGSGVLRLAENAIAGNSTASGALTFIDENLATPSGSMFAYSAVAYATGWQIGDVRGAYLCDTTTGNITGTAELVTNGDFATDTTAWTGTAGATLSQSSGEMIVTAGSAASYASAYQDITTVVGQTYIVAMYIRAGGTYGWGVVVETLSPYVQHAITSGSGTTPARVILQFTATQTTTRIRAYRDSASATNGQTVIVDNVSVKLAVPDRSYKGRGLQVVGTLSRAVVNTGNDLAAFSGFSAANYIEQPYNPDLDFGTGDFSIVVWLKTTDATAASRYMLDRTDSHTSPTAGRLRLLMDSSHRAAFWPRDATTDYFATGTTALNDGGAHQIVAQRRGSNLELHVDGRLEETVAITAGGNFSNTLASLFVGIRQDLASQWFVGNLGMLRLSATSLSAAQIARMYRDEAPLFNAGAKACLGGTSNAVASMDFDTWSQRLLVGTGDGASEFSGLVRVGYFDATNTTLTNDAMKAVACQGGYRSMAGGQQSIVVRDKVSQHDVVNAYPEQPPAWLVDEIAAIRALALVGLTLMPIRLKREATVTSLIARIDAGSPASMNDAQILQYAAQFLMLDKVIATDPMVADAAALLSVTTATELEDMLIQEDTHDAFDAAINDADIRAELFANTVARAAIVGSTRAVQRLTTSGTFDAFLANSNMRTSLFGSTTARAAILGSTTLRAFLLGTPTAGNLTLALSDTSMRTAMYADATTRTELLASSTMMDTLWGITAARDAAFNDATMRAAVLASTNAFTRLLANATARQAAWANANMPAAIAGSTAALAIIDDTQAHMDEALSSTYSAMRSALITTATSRGVIVASATWMRRCANVAGFMAAALADGTFLTAWRASSVLTARELPTETTTDANLTASSIISGYEEWKAADASTSSEWIAGTAPPAWLKYDFGSGKSINVHQLVLQAGGNRKPNAWVLEGSNDNSAWTSVGSGNMANNTTQQLFTIAHSAGYRYLRWTVNSEHGGSQPGIADFDIKGFEIQ